MPARSNKPRRYGCVMLVVLATALGCDPAPPPSASPSTSPKAPRKVYALGSLEPAGGVISISAAPGDRLKALDPDVAVGALAPKDGLLGVMASHDAGAAQLKALATKRRLALEKHALDAALADAQIKNAEASLAQSAAKRRELELQGKRIAYLEEAAAIAAEDLKRLIELYAEDGDLVTPHQIRRKTNQADQAQKDLEIAREMRNAGLEATASARAAARANLEAATLSRRKLDTLNPVQAIDEEIALAKQALTPALLVTPGTNPQAYAGGDLPLAAGDAEPGTYTVLQIFLRGGEAVTRTPVLQVGDLSSIVCVAEVYEADAKRISKGQEATLTSEAFDDAFASGIKGTVVSKSPMVASPGLQARNPLAPVDRSVVEVRVAIDPQDQDATQEAAQWIGLQVKVAFDTP
ncbi:MAG: HlyD family efflux transporter periplasmic adaptor subunit [Planctomycetota bacterium]